ncbi:MAG: PIN domain-containing protein [Nitrospirota bacterium]|nr:PIN domain-containing protein [Nitrospirota bacterium]
MYLFDTNILSEVIKKKASQTLLERLSNTSGLLQFTSCICVMELRYGSSRRPDHKTFWQRIEKDILPLVRVLPITQETAIVAGDVAAVLSSQGRSISPEDLLIAATAIEGGLTLVTANIRHFEQIKGLKVENWLR